MRFAFLRKLIEWWALAGGFVLVALVLLNAYSLVAGELFGAPVAGTFELVEIGVAVAAFAFLPYCQLSGAHVTADIFTTAAGPRTLALFGLLAGVIAILVSAVLLWRMTLGLNDYREYEEVTAIIGLPVWYAFVPILMSLVLLVAASLVSLIEAGLRTRAASAGS
ncbi:MAG: dicarboxylate transporter [Pseudomonadota bacterium]